MASARMPSPRRAGLAAIALLLLWTGFDAARLGLSDLIARESRFALEHPSAHADPASIRAGFEKALALSPASPQLLDELGRLDDRRAGAAGETAGRALREQALGYYRRAVAARPTSPHAQLGLVVVKLRLGQIDREFSVFLDRALAFGPWEPQLQLLAIHAGLAAWQGLPAESRDALRRAMKLQMSWVQVDQRLEILALLKRYRRADLIAELAAALPAALPAERSVEAASESVLGR